VKFPNVFTIASSAPFAETLARGLIARAGDDPLALSSAVIYLPTRRAARTFGDAFARVLGGAALLPQFRALGDSEEDELLFDPIGEGLELAPAIRPLRRQLLLAQLVRQWDRRDRDGTLSFAQCAALADSLAKVMDEVETQGCDLTQLKDLAPENLAEHWEGITRFLAVIRDTWPAILAEEKALNPAAQRALALKTLGTRLEASRPQHWVIAAGSTGSIPATAELMAVIARLPQGAVVLPGLDMRLDDESWNSLDPGHPQFGLGQLLRTIEVSREDVQDWFAADHNPARETLLSETLRPAPTTDAWRALAENGDDEIAEGVKDLGLITAADPAQEALAIALALRESLETWGRTAALVTPDRNLARRVAAEMARWNIAIDDSAGRGQDHAAFRARARELDRWCLRGPRPDAGLAGIAKRIETCGQERFPPPAEALSALRDWWSGIAETLAPLETIYAQQDVPLPDLIAAHVTAAEALACDEKENCILWANSDGEQAATLCAALEDDGQDLPPIEPGSYAALFRHLAMKAPVRAAFGRHPRLAILGPLEARLQRFDLTILGGLNEGSWPRAANTDPWFSRPMRATLGLEQPERSIGLAAHDFAVLAAGPCVLLTRSLKADGAPTVASRWLQRLEQLTRGLGLSDALSRATDYSALAAQLVDVPLGPRLERPAPRPPVEVRPRKLSVTEIETWLRDPYAIYAKHVLRLRPLDALDEPVGPLERGNILHKALEEFVKAGGGSAERLIALADTLFERAGIPKAVLAVWRPRFLGAARAFVDFEQERRGTITASHLEKRGALELGGFTLTGIADRIDVLRDGRAAILDYKTGAVPSAKQVEQLLSPQLPLEAAMLAEDGFGIGKFTAEELVYFSLAGEKQARKPRAVANPVTLAGEAVTQLVRRIAWFNQQETPYRSRIKPYRADIAGDYDHLARVKEWSPSGWGEEP